jgi:hypothetical protein
MPGTMTNKKTRLPQAAHGAEIAAEFSALRRGLEL